LGPSNFAGGVEHVMMTSAAELALFVWDIQGMPRRCLEQKENLQKDSENRSRKIRE